MTQQINKKDIIIKISYSALLLLCGIIFFLTVYKDSLESYKLEREIRELKNSLATVGEGLKQAEHQKRLQDYDHIAAIIDQNDSRLRSLTEALEKSQKEMPYRILLLVLLPILFNLICKAWSARARDT